MDLNILKPGKAVESAFAKPNLLLALALVVLPALAWVASRAFYGIGGLEIAAYAVFSAYVTFFVLVVAVFLMGSLLDYGKTKGKFLGLFSALSLVQILALAAIIISFLALPLALSPVAMDFALQAGKSANEEMMVAQVKGFVESNPDAVNLPVFLVLAAIGLVLLLWGFCLTCLCVKRFTESNSLTALILAVIAFIIVGTLLI